MQHNCKTISIFNDFPWKVQFFSNFWTLLIILSITPKGIIISFAYLIPLWIKDINKLLTVKERKPEDFLEHFSSLQSCCVVAKDIVLPSVLIKITIKKQTKNKTKQTKNNSLKKTYRWPRGTWKDAQHHYLLEKCKSELQWGITSHQSEWPWSKNLEKINAGKGVVKREPSCTVGGNVNWYKNYGEQYGGSLKN